MSGSRTHLSKWLMLAAMGLFSFSTVALLPGCEQESSSPTVPEQVEEAAEETGRTLEDAAQEAQDAAEEAAQEGEAAVEDMMN